MLSPSESQGHGLLSLVWNRLLGSLSGLSPVSFARGAPPAATISAGDVAEVKVSWCPLGRC